MAYKHFDVDVSNINKWLTTFFSAEKIGLCLFPNTCAGLGVHVISDLELRQEGLTFNNYASAVSADDAWSMRRVILMLLVDVILYMILAWSAIQ